MPSSVYILYVLCAYILKTGLKQGNTWTQKRRYKLWCVFTCKCVSSLISEIPYCLQQLVFSGEIVELPLCAGVSTVLGQTWNKNTSLPWIPLLFFGDGPLGKVNPLHYLEWLKLISLFFVLFFVASTVTVKALADYTLIVLYHLLRVAKHLFTSKQLFLKRWTMVDSNLHNHNRKRETMPD